MIPKPAVTHTSALAALAFVAVLQAACASGSRGPAADPGPGSDGSESGDETREAAGESGHGTADTGVRKSTSADRVGSPAGGASPELPRRISPKATVPELTEGDLMTRLYTVADDSMQGRLAGTPGNARATSYIAAEARRIGLEPAGEDGTYFQTIPLVVPMLDPASRLRAGGAELRAFQDYLPRDQGPGARSIDGTQAVYAGTWGDARLLPAEGARGRLVVLSARPGPGGGPAGTVPRDSVSQRFEAAAGIAVATLEDIPPEERALLSQYGPALATADSVALPSFMYVRAQAAAELLGVPVQSATPGQTGRIVEGSVPFVERPAPAPARNVVALLRGSDARLRGQYVAIGAHNDHVGVASEAVDHDSLRAHNRFVRPGGVETPARDATPEEARRIRAAVDSLRALRPARRDSIANGADDDGSGTAAVLEIAEALAKGPERPERSILFVWHTAEELGLFGSQWFTDHPTVPRDSIVAQINIDMIGRGRPDDVAGGGPGYLQLIGSRRLSTELGDLVERVNAERRHGLTFDYQFDADGHPLNYYCRSDHYMYARYGIPVVFFSTGGHRDYHVVTDEPQYVDYSHLARVAEFVRDVVLTVGGLDHRPVVDKPKPDPHGVCQQ